MMVLFVVHYQVDGKQYRNWELIDEDRIILCVATSHFHQWYELKIVVSHHYFSQVVRSRRLIWRKNKSKKRRHDDDERGECKPTYSTVEDYTY